MRALYGRPSPRQVRYARRDMVRWLVRTGVLLAANAIGLIVAAIVLDGFAIDVTSFLVALAIFTAVVALLTPLFAAQLRRRSSSALGGVALIATLAALLLTDLVSDGFAIDGVGTWLVAAVVVWGASLVAAFILPFLGLKKYLEERRTT